MPSDKTSNPRKRMIVEEVSNQEVTTPEVANEPEPVVVEEASQPQQPVVAEPVKTVETAPSVQNMGDYSSAESVNSSNSITWILVPGIMLLGALLGGIIFYQNKVNSTSVVPTPTPTVTTTAQATPTPTPVASVDLTKYTLVLQNGSGIKGEAGKVKDLLETAGFKVGTTGNAAKFDYTTSVIQAKSSVDDGFITKLKEVLGESYKLAKEETLKDTSKDDVIIVIGSTKS